MRKITLSVNENGITLLDFLKKNNFSRRVITKLKNNGKLFVNGENRHTNFVLSENDTISLTLSDEKTLLPNAKLDVEIVYDDEDVVVFNKPCGMATHPSIRHYEDTLGNFFSAKYEGLSFRPINRLDRDTSGLCLCAKNQYSASQLSSSFEKIYFAICEGIISCDGEIDAPIARMGESIIMREVRADGQSAKTLYTVLEQTKSLTFLRIKLLTGRTHQIRVHFSHIGHPLCGDDMYGGGLELIQRQALHCGEIMFTHPITGEKIELFREIPEDMKNLLIKE